MQYFWPTNPNIVGCYVLRPFAHPVACCSMLIACCCANFKTGQTFQPTTPNISFAPWLLSKHGATMLDSFAQLFQHCWGHAHSLRMVYKTYGLYPSHDALQVPTLLGVAASIYTPPPTRTQQLPMLLVQQCWELLSLFAYSLSNIWKVALITLF